MLPIIAGGLAQSGVRIPIKGEVLEEAIGYRNVDADCIIVATSKHMSLRIWSALKNVEGVPPEKESLFNTVQLHRR